MDLTRITQLAGLGESKLGSADRAVLTYLTEVVQLPDDLSLEDLMKRLDACKRALSIVNQMKDPADKKKWMSATFVNLNKVRGALQRMLAKMDASIDATGGDELSAQRLRGDGNAAV